jgi:hypothetical protein
MPPAVAAAMIQLWQSGTLSKQTAYQKLAPGEPTNPNRDFDEQSEIDQDGLTCEQPADGSGD